VDVGNCWNPDLEYAILTTTTKRQKRKAECREGSEARKNFEKTMKALFQVPKSVSKKPKRARIRRLYAAHVPAGPWCIESVPLRQILAERLLQAPRREAITQVRTAQDTGAVIESRPLESFAERSQPMACQKTEPYYSVDSDVYHVCRNCTLGDNIESDKRESGNPGKRRRCQSAKTLSLAESSVKDWQRARKREQPLPYRLSLGD
jgi:hypothetical protein